MTIWADPAEVLGKSGWESGVVADEQAWHGLAVVHDTATEGVLTPEIALVKGGIDWQVIKEPVYRKGTRVEGKFFTVRADSDKVLGVVGDRYEVLQNIEGFAMLRDLVDSDDIQIETAISLREGRLICITATRPDHIKIGGEDVIPRLVWYNTHDGLGGGMIATPERVVCRNTLRLAIGKASGIYKIKHTRNIRERIAAARAALEISFEYTDTLALVGEELLSTKISDAAFDEFLLSLYQVPEDEGMKRTRRMKEFEAVREVYRGSENLNDIRGTAWGALNAVVEYNQHYKAERTPFAKTEKILHGGYNDQRALALLNSMS